MEAPIRAPSCSGTPGRRPALGVLLLAPEAGPVLKTPLSGKGHAHPVTAMEQVGTQNATNLVTASNDGRLCVWSLAMLNTPQETFDLKNESKTGRREPSAARQPIKIEKESCCWAILLQSKSKHIISHYNKL